MPESAEMDQINEYLLEVKSHLHLDSKIEKDIVAELYTHLHEKEMEIHSGGKPLECSRELAVKSMGRPRVVARLFHETYSTGNLKDALLTGLPYAVVSILFASHLWRNSIIAPAAFAVIVAVTFLGWWWGKPNWLYSWVGFSLFPLLVACFTSRHHIIEAVDSLAGASVLSVVRGIGVVILYILAARFILLTTIRVARRDWLLASFMLLPLPVLGIWLYHLEQIGGFFQPVNPHIFVWDPQMASVTALMAISLGACVLLRQRTYRMIGLIIICMNTSAYVTHCIWTEMSLLPVVLVSVCLLALLLMPIFAFKPLSRHGRELLQWIGELEGRNNWMASR